VHTPPADTWEDCGEVRHRPRPRARHGE
jgi:hypothetical protein